MELQTNTDNMSPHDLGAVYSSKQEDPAISNRQDHLLTDSVPCLCPDSSEWARIPQHLFSPLLHEQREERHGLLTKHYNI